MASKRHQRRKACDDKVRHPDRHSAVQALIAAKRHHNGFMCSYGCRFCAGWHIGHYRSGVRS